MRYPASEKAEIIRLVEQSHLPVKQTLAKLGVPRTTFYRWCDLLQLGGIDALEDHRPLPGHVWNRVRNPREYVLLVGERTALTVCHAMSVAMAATSSGARTTIPVQRGT